MSILDFDTELNPNGEMNLEYYAGSDQWDIVGPVSIFQGVRSFQGGVMINEGIMYTMNIKRKPEFYLYVLTLPTIILVILSSLTFLLPVESGEKVCNKMYALLQQRVYIHIQTVVSTFVLEKSSV